jgi:hypothetical protein
MGRMDFRFALAILAALVVSGLLIHLIAGLF